MICLDIKGEVDQDLFRQFIQSQADVKEISLPLVTDITDGKLSVMKLIELLDDVINSEELSIRQGGIDILTTILSELPSDFLNATEITNFINFFCSRFFDHHSLLPSVLRGLLALVKMRNLPDGIVSRIFTQINLNFTCQSQPVADRRVCYQLMQVIMDKKPAELQALGPDFVCGYLSIIDGERDPRNLMFLFENLPRFFNNFPLGHLAEDAFEAVSCYFPIDFRSNPNDPRGITRDDLSNSLMPCLTASEKFHPFVVDMAMEKFSSDLEIAKLDSMILLKRCFDDFSPDIISSSWSEIVPLLVNELKPGKANYEIQQSCVDVISHILTCLSKHNKSGIESDVLVLIYSNLETFINDIHLSFFLPTIKFLARISSASNIACQFLVPKIVQKLFYFPLQQTSQVSAALESLNLLLTPCVTYKINCTAIFGSTWKQITELLLSSCEESKKEVLMAALPVAANTITLFSSEEKKSLYLLLLKRIQCEVDGDIWQTCADCLRLLASTHRDEVKKFVDSELLDSNDRSRSNFENERIFKFWCVLAPVPGFETYLDAAVRLYLQDSANSVMKHVIGSLKYLIVREKSNTSFLNIIHNDLKLTDYLLRWWHAGNIALSDVGSIFDDEQAATSMACIITIIVRALEQTSQMDLAVDFFKLMIGCSQRFMSSFYYVESIGDINSPDLHCSLSIVSFKAILHGIHPEILTEALDKVLAQIVKYLVTVAVYCSRSICCHIACRCLATILNKFLEDSSLKVQIEFLYSSAVMVFEKRKIPLTINAINMLFYAAKSLIYRNYPDAQRSFDVLFAEISNPEIHGTIQEGFYVLSLEDEYFLTSSSHFKVDPDFHERLFSSSVPKLLELYRNDNKSLKHVCAVSVIHVLAKTPRNVFQDHLTEIIPLFIAVLVDNASRDTIILALKKIVELLEENSSVFEEYVETFLSKLLHLARIGEMGVRIAALQCLLQFTKLKPAVVLPFRDRVTADLIQCLDDHKRLVRREAVKTRCGWLVLGSV